MKKVRFGIFGEDSATRIFMAAIIPKMIEAIGTNIVFEHNVGFSTHVHGASKDRVKKMCVATPTWGRVEGLIDVCFVGRDADSDSEKDTFERLQKDFKAEIDNANANNYIILFFPVRAIEYWYYHIKFSSDITSEEPIETKFSKDEMKINIFGTKKNSETKNNPIAEALMRNESINIQYLCNKSVSFNAFYQELKTFVDNQNLT
jgi:hypothetical protein